MSPEEMQEQSAHCIFCKIIKGEIPAKKVYEDEVMLAILDIHPAAKGHLLIIPKEHQPILPLITFEQQQHIFKKTQSIASALKEAVLCSSTTIFVANGGAAGQQSPHFLFHVIPREEGDMLETLSLPHKGNKEENDALVARTSQPIIGMMQAYLQETGRQETAIQQVHKEETGKLAKGSSAEEKTEAPETINTEDIAIPESLSNHNERLDQLIQTITENEDLRDAIMFRPNEVKQAAATIPKWQELFFGVDIDELSNNLKIMYAAKKKENDEQQAAAKTESQPVPSLPSKPDLDKISKLL